VASIAMNYEGNPHIFHPQLLPPELVNNIPFSEE
jgi:hypothetical protein